MNPPGEFFFFLGGGGSSRLCFFFPAPAEGAKKKRKTKKNISFASSLTHGPRHDDAPPPGRYHPRESRLEDVDYASVVYVHGFLPGARRSCGGASARRRLRVRARERRSGLFLRGARRCRSRERLRGGALLLAALQEQPTGPDPRVGEQEGDGTVGLCRGPDGGENLFFFFFSKFFFLKEEMR